MGYNIPAFIRETVERAKIAAIQRLHGGDIEGHVQEADLLAAAKAMEAHAAMLKVPEDKATDSPEVLVRIPQGHHRSVKTVLQSLGMDSNSKKASR